MLRSVFEVFSQLLIVDLGLVDEARPPAILIRANERVGAKQVDMVSDQHQVAAGKVRIDGA